VCTNIHVQITRSIALCLVRDDDTFSGAESVPPVTIRPCILSSCSSVSVDRDSAVGVAVGWRSGVRISVGARYSAPVHTDPGGYPASTTMVTGSLSRG
jgi:hypothetical protein